MVCVGMITVVVAIVSFKRKDTVAIVTVNMIFIPSVRRGRFGKQESLCSRRKIRVYSTTRVQR